MALTLTLPLNPNPNPSPSPSPSPSPTPSQEEAAVEKRAHALEKEEFEEALKLETAKVDKAKAIAKKALEDM